MATDNYEFDSFDQYDEAVNPPPAETDFDRVVAARMSRRGFLGAAGAFGAVAALMGTSALTNPAQAAGHGAHSRLSFKQIATSTADTVVVPEGYNWHVVSSWGDALFDNSIAFDEATRGTAASQELAVGDNNDGMHIFQIDGRSVLVSNNEYTNRDIIHGNRESKKAETKDDALKSIAAHGVTISEIAEKDGKWEIVVGSKFNRRITASTPMEITGPARGHDLLKTAADPKGEMSLGTWNNCGNGVTPWGTYLACEENFNGYFSASDKEMEVPSELKRYSVGTKGWGYNWDLADERFDISKHINEPNRAGYVVEIDPANPNSTPKKRTALGRFKHENAEVVVASNGHVVVYLGDDERGEFLYRFVSHGKYSAGGDNSSLLDEGTLSVAKFNEDGMGEWIALTPETTGMKSQAEISIHTRQAASAVGATTMDRPEWVAANPAKAEAYCCLTNNKNRGVKPNKGGDDFAVNGPNPRDKNHYGQIVRWAPENQDHTAAKFEWSLFVVAGNPTVHSDAYAGSSNVNADNMFNSPDGLAFSENGLLWIQTDGNYKNKGDFAGQGNNQMLVADPETGEIKRFLVGPLGCEITGFAWTADRKTLMIGVQHPGEKGTGSTFPLGGTAVPRSSIIAVNREDGQVIG